MFLCAGNWYNLKNYNLRPGSLVKKEDFMKQKFKKKWFTAAAVFSVTLSLILSLPVRVNAVSYEHTGAFVNYGMCTSGEHKLWTTVNSVTGYAKASGMSVQQSYGHELIVSGTAFLSTGSGCGGYYRTENTPSSTLESTGTGACTGIPLSASGTAYLYYVQYGPYMVRLGAPAADFLPN